MSDNPDVEALRRHAQRFRFNGFPIFDPDTDEQIGVVAEPRWQWADLTDAQREVIELDASLTDLDAHGITADFALWASLHDYGVACFHRWVNHEPTHRECRMCRVWEQLPGRIVWVEDRGQIRVQEPPPHRLVFAVEPNPSSLYVAEDDPSPFGPVIERQEYEWTGSSYRRVGGR